LDENRGLQEKVDHLENQNKQLRNMGHNPGNGNINNIPNEAFVIVILDR
jgi:hypothetical protein